MITIKQNAGKLSEAAIDGMVKELKDPYSEYMTKDETKSFNEDVSRRLCRHWCRNAKR